jgi:NAD(P)-dependent dehydrogenase (short-subunit alcohol dehydrogenase family)
MTQAESRAAFFNVPGTLADTTGGRYMSDLTGKVAAVTGGGGVLCSAMSCALSAQGAAVAVLDLNQDAAQRVVDKIRAAGGKALAIATDVLSKESLESALQEIHQQLGSVNILINGAGGNKPEATASPDKSFFDVPIDAIQWVFNLNCLGTILPCQVFVPDMVRKKEGVVINVASMAGIRPLTRVLAYSAAKAAIANFTQWLAVHMAQEYSPKIRVNAIAPGFFLTAQNEYLLLDKQTNKPTERGQLILSHTPSDRYGNPEDLLGTLRWLVSDEASFVTGIVVPIDGGFSAFGGV